MGLLSSNSPSRKVYASHELPGPRLQELAARCELSVWRGEGLLPVGELRRQLGDAVGLLCLLTDRIDRDLLERAPYLSFVSSMSVGVDHIDLPLMTARGIPVGHTPGVLVDTTADTAISLMLAAARRIAQADRYIREGQWRRESAWSPDFFVGKDVSGATLGIVGLGQIGQAVARRAKGFDMRVLAWNRSRREVPGVESVELEQLLQHSDFVSINVALTAQTRNLLNAERIAMIKPGAVLVNTARGGIVDEQSLAAALDSGAIFAAGFDVFAEEPLSLQSPLLNHERMVLTPHLGSATIRTRRRMADLAIENAMAALAGERMPHCANPSVYD